MSLHKIQKAAEKLKAAFIEMDTVLDDHGDHVNDIIVPAYPFEQDFSELTVNVKEWCDEIQKRKQEIYPCVCLTCGVKNDFSHPDGLCQNGHDDWLEYRDILGIHNDSEPVLIRAMETFSLSKEELTELFINETFTQFEIQKHHQKWYNFEDVKAYQDWTEQATIKYFEEHPEILKKILKS